MKKLVAIAIAIITLSSVASAEDASLHIQGGPAEVLHAPFSAPGSAITNGDFHTGGSGEVKVLFKLIPNLVLGPDVSMMMLPQSGPHPGISTGPAVLWNVSLGMRLQGNRDASWGSPYLELAGGVSSQANIWNPSTAATVGADFPVYDGHYMWLGPYVSWTHTYQTHSDADDQTLLLQHHDSNVLIAGVSLSFDFVKDSRGVLAARK